VKTFLNDLEENAYLEPTKIINMNGKVLFDGFTIHKDIYLEKQIRSD
jgi:disulfide oxidoreductase YuzD